MEKRLLTILSIIAMSSSVLGAYEEAGDVAIGENQIDQAQEENSGAIISGDDSQNDKPRYEEQNQKMPGKEDVNSDDSQETGHYILPELCQCSTYFNSLTDKWEGTEIKRDLANSIQNEDLVNNMAQKFLKTFNKLKDDYAKNHNEYELLSSIKNVLGDLDKETDLYKQLWDIVKDVDRYNDEKYLAEHRDELKEITTNGVKTAVGILQQIKADPTKYVRKVCACKKVWTALLIEASSSIFAAEQHYATDEMGDAISSLMDALNWLSGQNSSERLMMKQTPEYEMITHLREYLDMMRSSVLNNENLDQVKEGYKEIVSTIKELISNIQAELDDEVDPQVSQEDYLKDAYAVLKAKYKEIGNELKAIRIKLYGKRNKVK